MTLSYQETAAYRSFTARKAIALSNVMARTSSRKIAALERSSSYLGDGLLKLSPIWDPLRSDLRFEKIVVLLAPEESRS